MFSKVLIESNSYEKFICEAATYFLKTNFIKEFLAPYIGISFEE
ncbi:6797_t:CDS:2 [Dentiscutata erythropus]|uniref:6797_t:CDS:1 n=1 Tax=Dentiscutata erythropus TaxID=1348616 RepID=A0A9N9DWW2_9GLOM|nr:6797_t:CDS:2 [Dentiscutata erythropus]